MQKFILTISFTLTLVSCSPAPTFVEGEPDESSGTLWLRFAQITDIHVLDEESPARFLRLDGFAGMMNEAWRPQEAYAAQGLDNALQVLNAWHAGMFPHSGALDFVLVTGDVVDNAQRNELQWFVDTMDGKEVTPDSGLQDGFLRNVSPDLNPKLPFRAVGLAPDIPWYVARGNHDTHCTGVFPLRAQAGGGQLVAPVPWPVAWFIGLWQVQPLVNVLQPTSNVSPAVVTGAGPATREDNLQLDMAQLRSGVIPADPERRFISKRDFITAFLESDSLPRGHGFTERNLEQNRAWYSVRPDAAVPIRLIVLDTVAEDAPQESLSEYGIMTQEQFNNFLVPELAAAREHGEFVIIVSHHPSTDFDRLYPKPTIGTWLFRQYLTAQPNILLHLCGHTHAHRFTVIPGRYPYPEVETASLIDLPQEMRVVEIRYNFETRAVVLVFRAIRHTAMPTPMGAEFARRAALDQQATGVIYTEAIGDRVYSITLPRPDFQPAGASVP